MLNEGVFALLSSAGAEWVMWLLAGLSACGVALMLERVLLYRSEGTELRCLAEQLDAHLSRGDAFASMQLVAAQRGLAARVATAGLRLAGRGRTAAQEAMRSAITVERARLEGRLVLLATLGNNAPFVGLLGTVIGVMNAFRVVGTGQPGRALGSQALMGAIGEALAATAVGIAVALPAVFAYNALQRWSQRILAEADALSCLVAAYLDERPKGDARAVWTDRVADRGAPEQRDAVPAAGATQAAEAVEAPRSAQAAIAEPA